MKKKKARIILIIRDSNNNEYRYALPTKISTDIVKHLIEQSMKNNTDNNPVYVKSFDAEVQIVD